MALETIAVTGGNGKIGVAILKHLSNSGYETANLSRGKRRESIADAYITTDLLDAGETYGALATSNADAVIHMGTIPTPYNHPQFKTFESNMLSAVHILEASESLGLESVCLASSINAIGAEHQERRPEIEYLPVDEEHPRTPDDIYGIAKHAMEVTAEGFGRRPTTDLTISTLRYPWVPNQNEIEEYFVNTDRTLTALRNDNPRSGHEVLFSYIHIDDAARIARKAVEADYQGHETFWAVASDTTAEVETDILVEEFFPGVESREDFGEFETLFDISKSERLLQWIPEHSWRTNR